MVKIYFRQNTIIFVSLFCHDIIFFKSRRMKYQEIAFSINLDFCIADLMQFWHKKDIFKTSLYYLQVKESQLTVFTFVADEIRNILIPNLPYLSLLNLIKCNLMCYFSCFLKSYGDKSFVYTYLIHDFLSKIPLFERTI